MIQPSSRLIVQKAIQNTQTNKFCKIIHSSVSGWLVGVVIGVNVYNKLQTAYLIPHYIAVNISRETIRNLSCNLLTSTTTCPLQIPLDSSANLPAFVRLTYPLAPNAPPKPLYYPPQIFSDFQNSLPLDAWLSIWFILHVTTYVPYSCSPNFW